MNIGIDGNEANIDKRVGVGQFAYNILLELSKAKSNNTYYVFLKNQPLADMPPVSKNWRYIVFGPQKLWTKIALPFYLYFLSPKLDLFYSPSHYSPHFSPFPTIPTIHDLGYLNTKQQFTKKDFYQLTQWTEHSIKQAQKIIAVSEFTKNEIVRIYQVDPGKISVVFNGIGQVPKFDDNTLQKFKITKPYFLYLGTLKPNKNIPFLITEFSKFIKQHLQHQLVIAGKKGWLYDEIFNVVKQEKIETSVIFTDFITESEKYCLYHNALATVLPSLYEGFGIPAIEAQQSGSPLIVSHIPAYDEIIDPQSALIIDPIKNNDITNAMVKIQDSKLRQELIKQGKINSAKYTWSNSVHSLLKAFDTI